MTDPRGLYGLEDFAGGYFHQDYDVVSGTPDDVIAAFKKIARPADITQVITDIEALIASTMTDAEIYNLWVMQWQGSYDPLYDGISYRQWFTHVLELLRSGQPE